VTTGVAAALIGVGAGIFLSATPPTAPDRATYDQQARTHNTRIITGGALLTLGGIASATAIFLFALHRDAPRIPIGVGFLVPAVGSRLAAPGLAVSLRY
jgi:hypothetical protein